MLGIGFSQPGFRNDYAYFTDSPLYPDPLDEALLMPSVSSAVGFPFGNQPIQKSEGVMYGIDTGDRIPILLDRFSWDSYSMAVVGTLGSGKSYAAKLELIRSVLSYPGLRIIVVDPKKEYKSTVEALGGESRKIAPGKEYSFDRRILNFEVDERGEFENVAALVDLVGQIYSATSKNREKTLVLIDEARILLTDDAGRHLLNQFVLEARDINVAVHMVTQSGSHFTNYRMGRDILNHVPGRLFFRHEKHRDYPSLSEQEQTNLLKLRSGGEAEASEAVLHVSNVVNTRIKIESTPAEHQVIEPEEESLKVGE
jgi:type IV secretory pathway VirB4 component